MRPTTNRQPFLLIGLGNPGKSYAGNRHNIGFMTVDRIAADYGFSKPKSDFGGIVAEGAIGTVKAYAFKPMGYMNLSGDAAGKIACFYKIPLEHIIAFHDELDLPLGKLRVKRGGGNGGHNGLKSLDAHLGPDYLRIRIGIGHPLRRSASEAGPGDKDMVSDYVLSDFAKTEKSAVELMLDEISKHIGLLMAGNEAEFMNKIARAAQELHGL